MSGLANDDDVIWHIGVFDAHCHPTDIAASIKEIANMKTRALTTMATRSQDQDLVADAAAEYLLKSRHDLSEETTSRYVIPAFGWHPWFSHQIFDDRVPDAKSDAVEHYQTVLTPNPDDLELLKSLPTPKALSQFLDETESRLQQFPFALVGEIGLDRSFRLPEGPTATTGETSDNTGGIEDYTAGSRQGRPLTPYRVGMDHQKTIFRAQLELAAKLRRPVSVHSVQAHGVVFELLQVMWKGHEKKSKREQKRRQSVPKAHDEDDLYQRSLKTEAPLPYPPRICMHSYSGPPDALRQFLNHSVPAEVYFSFSSAINFSNPSSAKVISAIKAVPDDRLLVESDLHCAGGKMDELLKDIILKVCEIKGWPIRDGATRLKQNWERFIFGEKEATSIGSEVDVRQIFSVISPSRPSPSGSDDIMPSQ